MPQAKPLPTIAAPLLPSCRAVNFVPPQTPLVAALNPPFVTPFVAQCLAPCHIPRFAVTLKPCLAAKFLAKYLSILFMPIFVNSCPVLGILCFISHCPPLIAPFAAISPPYLYPSIPAVFVANFSAIVFTPTISAAFNPILVFPIRGIAIKPCSNLVGLCGSL